MGIDEVDYSPTHLVLPTHRLSPGADPPDIEEMWHRWRREHFDGTWRKQISSAKRVRDASTRVRMTRAVRKWRQTEQPGGYSDDEEWAGEKWKQGTMLSGIKLWRQWSRKRMDTDRWMADTDWSAWNTWKTRKAFSEWREHAKLRSKERNDRPKRRCLRHMLDQTQHWRRNMRNNEAADEARRRANSEAVAEAGIQWINAHRESTGRGQKHRYMQQFRKHRALRLWNQWFRDWRWMSTKGLQIAAQTMQRYRKTMAYWQLKHTCRIRRAAREAMGSIYRAAGNTSTYIIMLMHEMQLHRKGEQQRKQMQEMQETGMRSTKEGTAPEQWGLQG